MDLATLAAAAESADPPSGDGERYAGYGVMGLPFSSGHVLAMRRFPASSIGSAYNSVWHRTPAGRWSFWQNQAPEGGCSRYFSAEVSTVVETSVVVGWPTPNQLHVSVPEVGFDWRSTMGTTVRLKTFNALSSALPDRAWRSPRLLAAMGPVAGALLGFGSVTMTGRAPNGQSFVVNPRKLWLVTDSTATLAGVSFGRPGPLSQQATLGDFVCPRKGVFALGRAFFN